MELSATTNAIRQYQTAKTQIGGPSKSSASSDAASSLGKSVDAFSKVFETVETSSQAMMNGTGDAQTVVEALANAEVALETAVTVRNRVVEAYQELLRMPI
jgi:flagellar hook-basal body complex protein FliE